MKSHVKSLASMRGEQVTKYSSYLKLYSSGVCVQHFDANITKYSGAFHNVSFHNFGIIKVKMNVYVIHSFYVKFFLLKLYCHFI